MSYPELGASYQPSNPIYRVHDVMNPSATVIYGDVSTVMTSSLTQTNADAWQPRHHGQLGALFSDAHFGGFLLSSVSPT